jgi:hypothetical protein
LIRINDRILASAGTLLPMELRTLDAIHLATAQQLGGDLARVVTYDERMGAAAEAIGWPVAAPARALSAGQPALANSKFMSRSQKLLDVVLRVHPRDIAPLRVF